MEPKIDILIKNVDRKQWYAFLTYCKLNDTSGTVEIRKIIAKYIKGYEIQTETGININDFRKGEA